MKNEEKGMMTDEQSVKDIACETKQESKDIEVQYDTLNNSKTITDVDESALLMFLRKKKNLLMDAFLEQSTLSLSGNWFRGSKSSSQTNCTMQLKVKFGKDKEKEEFQINKIALNMKGMVLAIAVGGSKHEGSCEHTAFVSGWNIFRSNIDFEEPHWSINVNGCVTALAWHPRKSTIFAAGTMNGVISVYDIGKEEGNPLQYQTQLNEYLHYDNITQLGWCIYKVNNNQKVLQSSCSVDGKLQLWDMADKLKYPKRGYLFEKSLKGIQTRVSCIFFF